MRKNTILTALLALGSAAIVCSAAEPPELIDYQGVLRDDLGDIVEDGPYNMAFYFYDNDGGVNCIGGTLLLTDAHESTGTGAVQATGGLFNVEIGGGDITPAAESSLAEVFRDNESVFLEVRVQFEVLCPRIHLVSSGYALNSDHLDGRDSSAFAEVGTANTFTTGVQTIHTGDAATSGVVVKGVDSQSASLQEWQDHSGTTLASVTAGGVFSGAFSGSFSGTFSGSFLGDGSGLTDVVAVDSEDSQLLDGYDSTYFLNTSSASQTKSGVLTVDSYSGEYPLLIYGQSGGRAESPTGLVRLAYNNYGIWAEGGTSGGFFRSRVWVNTVEIAAHSGGTFHKILGSAPMSFVQNHPEQPDQVVVYAAPEGDEAAVYTRGTARLTDGEARVALGDTFKWVANPDIGLTAHLTPRGECHGLYVSSLTSEELVVNEIDGGVSDVAFDYVVYGLRIGYEAMSTVRIKEHYSPLPPRRFSEEYYGQHPELRKYNALERFKRMRTDLSVSEPLDLTASRELAAAINVFDPEIDGKLDSTKTPPDRRVHRNVAGETPTSRYVVGTAASADGLDIAGSERASRQITLPVDEEGNVYAKSFRPSAADLASLVTVSEPVMAGDVLVIDPDRPGAMRLGRVPADTAVFGIVTGEPGVVLGVASPREQVSGETVSDTYAESTLSTAEGSTGARPEAQVPVVLSGTALCRVDAGYGSIRPGDLLTTSPTRGHAMRSNEPLPGTILGKALEPLDDGTGLIKILVMLR